MKLIRYIYNIPLFLLITILAAGVISLIGRVFSDFDIPADEDPYDLWRGVGVWLTAVLIAALYFLRRRRLEKDEKS